MNSATIFMDGQPIGKGRPRFTRMGRVYTPEKTRKFEHKLAAIASNYMMLHQLEPTTEPCIMIIQAQFEIPKSWTKKKKLAAAMGDINPGKPDIDNIAKIVLDSFNGVVFEDDAQVVDLSVNKCYGLEPSLTTIVYWGEECLTT